MLAEALLSDAWPAEEREAVADMSVIAEVLLSLAAIVLVSTVSVVVIARLLFRRIQRSRAVRLGMLRSRAGLSVGAQREVLRLRLRLQETLDSGQAALDLVQMNGAGSRGELPRLFRKIQDEGRTVETQLLLLGSERDPAVLHSALPVARARVTQIAQLVGRVRAAVAAGLGHLTDDTLETLGSDVDREVSALDAGIQELHALNRRDAVVRPAPHPVGGLSKGTES